MLNTHSQVRPRASGQLLPSHPVSCPRVLAELGAGASVTRPAGLGAEEPQQPLRHQNSKRAPASACGLQGWSALARGHAVGVGEVGAGAGSFPVPFPVPEEASTPALILLAVRPSRSSTNTCSLLPKASFPPNTGWQTWVKWLRHLCRSVPLMWCWEHASMRPRWGNRRPLPSHGTCRDF